MADLDKMARELLAAEYDADSPDSMTAERLRSGLPAMWWADDLALRAIRTALLTAPPGYVLVPESIDPVAAMDVLAGDGLGRADEDADLHQVFGWLLLFWKEYKQKLAAAPEVE